MPTLTLRLTPEQARALRARAEARGVAVETYLADLAARDLAAGDWARTADEAAALLAGRQRPEPPPSRETFYSGG